MFLSLRDITKRFGAVVALDDVSLDIEEGEFVCFLGPSGCGKTTLLRVIAGLETPDAAEIRLNGRNLLEVPARSRNFGIVFQSYSLFPNMTVARNIAYGLECRKWPSAEIPARSAAMLALVNLADQADRYPHQLSGGQQQRVALARALAPKPPCCCSTSRCRRSTPRCARNCAARSRTCSRGCGSRRSWSRMTSTRRWRSPTASSS